MGQDVGLAGTGQSMECFLRAGQGLHQGVLGEQHFGGLLELRSCRPMWQHPR